jgi:hypothetical protein
MTTKFTARKGRNKRVGEYGGRKIGRKNNGLIIMSVRDAAGANIWLRIEMLRILRGATACLWRRLVHVWQLKGRKVRKLAKDDLRIKIQGNPDAIKEFLRILDETFAFVVTSPIINSVQSDTHAFANLNPFLRSHYDSERRGLKK